MVKYVHLIIEDEEGRQVIDNMRTYMLHSLILDLVNNSKKITILTSEEKLNKEEILNLKEN